MLVLPIFENTLQNFDILHANFFVYKNTRFPKKLAKEKLFNSTLTSPGFMVVIEESEDHKGIEMGS